MISVKTLSAIRFGYGLGPNVPPVSRDTILAALSQPDEMVRKFPVKSTRQAVELAKAFRKARRQAKASGARDESALREARAEIRKAASLGLVQGMARILDSPSPFRERLVWFWADHFTAVAKNTVGHAVAPAYIDEAIRPHVAGRFSDMLKSVATHPFMLTYLDQTASTGPNSAVGKKRGRGLNENLAREVLELHTLGVGSGYTQDDVRQLAELMTGLTVTRSGEFQFNPRMAQEGAETVLGKPYGGGKPKLADVFAVLDDLALNPATARHLARKIAVHFVSDTPGDGLVDHLSAAYLSSGGELGAVYAALLEHPDAWQPALHKAKKPFDFIASALVALGLPARDLIRMPSRDQNRLLFRPLADMGQPFMRARGPDGWPEEADAWITPQGLASRISWSAGVAKKVGDKAGDPMGFLDSTLADAASERLVWAVRQAKSAEDGIMLVFASAQFNRR